jgi:hypothetical protein
VIRSDVRSFFRQLPGLFRNDYTALMLVVASLLPVIDMLWKGHSGSFTAVVAVVFVLPVKLALDLVGHFAEHGMLNLGGDRPDSVQS